MVRGSQQQDHKPRGCQWSQGRLDVQPPPGMTHHEHPLRPVVAASMHHSDHRRDADVAQPNHSCGHRPVVNSQPVTQPRAATQHGNPQRSHQRRRHNQNHTAQQRPPDAGSTEHITRQRGHARRCSCKQERVQQDGPAARIGPPLSEPAARAHRHHQRQQHGQHQCVARQFPRQRNGTPWRGVTPHLRGGNRRVRVIQPCVHRSTPAWRSISTTSSRCAAAAGTSYSTVRRSIISSHGVGTSARSSASGN